MEEKLRRYVDELFDGTVPSKKAVELKEEMIQNLRDKYNDLTAEGKTPEAAFNIAVAGIGDVSGLLKELENEAVAQNTTEIEAARRKSAMFTSIAVMMYILSALPLIMLYIVDSGYAERVGFPIMFLMAAGATGLLVFNSMTKPRPISSDTIVEEFREWQSDEKDRKALRKSISSAMWSLLVVAYFVVSFMTHAWHITWIIFLIGAALESFINIFRSLRSR